MVEEVLHFMATRKQRKGERVRNGEQDEVFKGILPRTYFLQLCPTS
jgi:hypothetical protein